MLIPYKKSIIYLLWIISCLVLFSSNFTQFKEMSYADTDDCMRIVRVKELVKSWHWYDSTLQRENAPFGLEMHWTRAHDLVILATATPFLLFCDCDRAIELAGAFVGLFFLLLISLCVYNIGCVFSQKVGIVAGMSMYWTYLFCQYVGFLRPDQHCLILLLFVCFIKELLYLLSGKYKSSAMKLGIICGISIWVAPELLMTLFLGISFILFYFWYSDEERLLADVIKISYIQSSIVFLLVFGIERKIGDLRIEYDKISVVHLYLSLSQTIYFLILGILQKRKISKGRKVNLSILIGILICSGLLFVFPKLILLSLANTFENLVVVNFLSNVSEMDNIFSSPHVELIYFIAILITFVYFLKSKITKYSLVLGYFFIFYSIAGAMALRIFPYFEILFAIIFANALVLFTRNCQLESLLMFVRPFIIFSPQIMVFLVHLVFVTLFVNTVSNNNNTDLSKNNNYNHKNAILYKFLDKTFQTQETILCPINFTPRILFYTKHKTVAGPYHRNVDGLNDLKTIYSATASQKEIFALFKKRKITIILANNKFRKEIAVALEEIPVPKSLQNIKVYKVKPEVVTQANI